MFEFAVSQGTTFGRLSLIRLEISKTGLFFFFPYLPPPTNSSHSKTGQVWRATEPPPRTSSIHRVGGDLAESANQIDPFDGSVTTLKGMKDEEGKEKLEDAMAFAHGGLSSVAMVVGSYYNILRFRSTYRKYE